MLKNDIHIGSIIKEIFLQSKMTVTQFAFELGCDRTHIYPIFNNKSIDTDRLIKISQTLNHNFFLEYFEKDKPHKDYLILTDADHSKIEEMIADPSIKIIKLIADV